MKLPPNVQKLAQSLGRLYGDLEVECWRDQHDGQNPTAPWQNGQWCGQNHYSRETEPELYELFETAVDAAGREVWERSNA